RAMMEGSMLFGGLRVVYAGILVAERGFRWRDVLLLGGAAGFAVATKHNNVFAVAMVFLACLTPIPNPSPVHRGRETASNLPDEVPSLLAGRGYRGGVLVRLFVAGITSLLVFYALNPAWWPNPVATAGAVIDLRTALLAVQTDVFDTYESFPAQMAGFWWQAIVSRPMFYEVAGWDVYIGEQIASYERSPWQGVRLPALISAPLMLVGSVALWRERTPARWIALVWAVGVALLTALLTPLEWQRYYLPAVPGLLLLAAHGTVIIAKRALRHLEHLRHSTTETTTSP
ncbi:MAG: hypothetical protein AAFV33_14735, partial [Chloroflexota bacterium]